MSKLGAQGLTEPSYSVGKAFKHDCKISVASATSSEESKIFQIDNNTRSVTLVSRHQMKLVLHWQ